MPSLRNWHFKMVLLHAVEAVVSHTIGVWMAGSWDADAWVEGSFVEFAP